MHSDLEKLVALQRVEDALRLTKKSLDELPLQRAVLERELTDERGRLDAARAALEQSQKNRRHAESELQALEAKRDKYKSQLMDVKTNKEYTAMLHEIEGVGREVSACEERILVEMEQLESLQAEVEREQQAFKGAERTHRERGGELDTQTRELETRRAGHEAERASVAQGLAGDLLALFERIARSRTVAVAEAKDGKCQQCHVGLRPQMFVDVKRNDQLVQCPSCSRILYFEPPVPVVDPQP